MSERIFGMKNDAHKRESSSFRNLLVKCGRQHFSESENENCEVEINQGFFPELYSFK